MSENDKSKKTQHKDVRDMSMDEILTGLEATNRKIEARNPVVYSGTYEPKPMSKEDKVVLSVFGLLGAGFAGLLIWAGVKEQKEINERAEEARAKLEAEEAEKKRKREELEKWKEEQRNAGMIVQRLYNGEWMAVPADTYKSANFRKS